MEAQSTTAEIVDDGERRERRDRRDRRGRVSWPKERREELLAEYERSGLSQAAFARREGVRYPTFAHWVQERRRDAAGKPAETADAAPRFVELGVRGSVMTPAGTLSVTLPDGLVVSGSDPRSLAGLVRMLQANAG
jgi:transposase-like protein